MPQHLVIVESPTKAKTIQKFLGKDYRVESSFGHVRDLPKSKLGVDVEKNFEPQYLVPRAAQKRVTELKKLAKKAQDIYFATDEDREGEAIAWHLQSVLAVPQSKAKRIVFHEITKSAIQAAIENPRELDTHLVDAQQARRILDRLVGYKLSPFLWKKVAKGLSAGRVQSVAVRLVVERERERQAFKTQEYWTIRGMFSKPSDPTIFPALLVSHNEKKIGKYDIANTDDAQKLLSDLQNGTFMVDTIESKEVTRKSPPPFTTSTLQQAANNLLGFSSKQTMVLAQQLYEGIALGAEGEIGLITYMRTDSLNLSEDFLNATQQYAAEKFGKEYIAEGKKFYKAKQKLAQEAHEAIRPTNVTLDPESVKPYLDARQYKLYSLIWNRAVASQLSSAVLRQTKVDITEKTKKATFRANGSVLVFDGFLKLYPQSLTENTLPDLKSNDPVEAHDIIPEQHFTEPPARYSEATLIKALEEYGIGRPSTYAPTLSTIQTRQYVTKEDRRFAPTEMGTLVNDVLVEHFPDVVDLQFTARMEDDLDSIAHGQKKWQPVISDFYQPFNANLMQKESAVSKKELTETATDEVCEKCGKPMVIKMGRFGKFLACTGYPDCRNTKPINGKNEPVEAETTDEKCPDCGKPLALKHGRFGKFFGCTGYPDCKYIKRIEKGTGVKCNLCDKGEIVEKRSRRGKTFYACNQYPECKNALWSKPTGEHCPTCSSLMIFGKDNTHVCSNKECTFKKETQE